MAWLLTIILGSVVGLLAALIMKHRQGVIADILVGMIGSIIGVWFFTEVLGIGPIVTPGTISLLNLVWAITGSIIVIAIVEALSYDSDHMKNYEESAAQRKYSKEVAKDYSREQKDTSKRK